MSRFASLLLVLAVMLCGCPDGPSSPPAVAGGGISPEAREAALTRACSRCHVVPPPEALPQRVWRSVLEDMYTVAGLEGGQRIDVSFDWAVAYFEERAPEIMPVRLGSDVASDGPQFKVRPMRPPRAPPTPATANVALLDVTGDERLELVVCDMRHGLVLYCRPYAADELGMIARLGHPCHAEVVDLDGDGRRDIVVADLGDFNRGDHEKGSVVLLRRAADGGFETVILAAKLPRPCDARPFDMDGDGDLDVAVAAFGWRKKGSVIVLENRTESGGPLSFEPRVIDPRHGAVNVCIADVDEDGRPDIVTLLAQEHEEIAAWLNRGDGNFVKRVLRRADHCAWGSSGIDVVDLDGDGDLDVLATNGDTLDDHILKPYHGIRWLENVGEGRYEDREVGPMYGAHGAVARDLDGDGDLDVIAGAFLPDYPAYGPEIRAKLRAESVVWFEQVEKGEFRRRVLEQHNPVHATLAAGDYDLDGDVDLVVGGFTMAITETDRLRDWIAVWEGQRVR